MTKTWDDHGFYRLVQIMPALYLPPEITDSIISAVCDEEGYVEKTYPTLLACCLVCHTWLPASRTQLFKTISLTSTQWRRYTLFVDRVLHSDTMSHYLASIHKLSITRPDTGTDIILQFLIEFAGRLPGLHELILTTLRLDQRISYSKWPLLFSQFPSITILMLSDCQFASFADLRRMLSALQSLEYLYLLDGIRWHIRPGADGQEHSYRPLPACWPALQYLNIWLIGDSQCMDTLLRWIAPSLVRSPLRTLEYHARRVTSDSLQEAAATMLDSVGGSVTDLTIGMHPQFSDLFTCRLSPTDHFLRIHRFPGAVHSSRTRTSAL